MTTCLCGCHRPAGYRGVSPACYQRLWKNGTLNAIALPATKGGRPGVYHAPPEYGPPEWHQDDPPKPIREEILTAIAALHRDRWAKAAAGKIARGDGRAEGVGWEPRVYHLTAARSKHGWSL